MAEFYVRVVEDETGKVWRKFGPHPKRKAEKIEDGLDRQLNHEKYHVRVDAVDADLSGENLDDLKDPKP